MPAAARRSGSTPPPRTGPRRWSNGGVRRGRSRRARARRRPTARWTACPARGGPTAWRSAITSRRPRATRRSPSRGTGTRGRSGPPEVPTGATGSELRAVSCSAANHCVAVGAYDTSDGSQVGFAERWDGTAWHLQHVAGVTGATGSELVGVACTSGTACTAVGDYADGQGRQRVLAEVWNGTAWRVEHTPTVAGAQAAGLTSVACTAATTCTAAGRYIGTRGDTDTLVEIRRGAWSGRSSPARIDRARSRRPSPVWRACRTRRASRWVTSTPWADRASAAPTAFAEAWDGRTWRIEAVAAPWGPTAACSPVSRARRPAVTRSATCSPRPGIR